MSNNLNLNRRGFFMFFLSEDKPNAPHITILGQIEDTKNQGFQKLWEKVKETRLTENEIKVELGKKDYFGVNSEFEVVKIKDVALQLQALHEKLLEITEELGYKLILPQYAGINYNPHISLSSEFTESYLRNTYHASGVTIDSIVLKESFFDDEGSFIRSEQIGSLGLT